MEKKNVRSRQERKGSRKPLRKYLEGSTDVTCKNFSGYRLRVKIISAKGWDVKSMLCSTPLGASVFEVNDFVTLSNLMYAGACQ